MIRCDKCHVILLSYADLHHHKRYSCPAEQQQQGHHPIAGQIDPLRKENERIYQKKRELEVRKKINEENRERAASERNATNEKLESIRKELCEKIEKVEDARIRLTLGVPPPKSDQEKSSVRTDAHFPEGIKEIEETFNAVAARLQEIAKRNQIDLSQNVVLQKEPESDPPITLREVEVDVNVSRGTSTSPTTVPSPEKGQEEAHLGDRREEQEASDIKGQLRAVRQSYLERGGRNPDILARIANLEKSAVDLAEEQVGIGEVDLRVITDQLAAIRRENAKVAQQLQELQQTRRSPAESVLSQPRHVVAKQHQYERQWEELREELALLRGQVALQKAQRDVDGVVGHGHRYRDLSSSAVHVMDSKKSVELIPEPDHLPPQSYDSESGFAIFYDFVSGLQPTAVVCALATSLYSRSFQFGPPGGVPTTLCQAAPPSHRLGAPYQAALLCAKQPVPRCPASAETFLVVELQVGVIRDDASPHHQNKPTSDLSATAWCKVPLFDNKHNLLSGWWRLPLHRMPVIEHLPIRDVEALPRYERAEIFIRLVNYRDAERQSLIDVDMSNLIHMYRHLPVLERSPILSVTEDLSRVSVTPSTRLPSQSQDVESHPSQPPSATRTEEELPVLISPPTDNPSSPAAVLDLGLQVVHVKHLPPGHVRLRLSVYDTMTGQVVQTDEGPVTCSTTVIKLRFRHQYCIFGQQEALFASFPLRRHQVLLVKVYLCPVEPASSDGPQSGSAQTEVVGEERMVAWAALNIVREESSPASLPCRLAEGRHTTRLFQPDLPDVRDIFRRTASLDTMPYGQASVTIVLYDAARRPASPPPSPLSSDEDEDMPEMKNLWLPADPGTPPSEPFKPGDGVDIYVDGCRFLPDCATISKVAGRVLDRQYHKVGRDISATLGLESDVYNPSYNHRLELREPRLPHTATLLLKIYTMDRWSGEVVIIGYATLKLFTISNTWNQPTEDPNPKSSTPPAVVSLNTGSHQLPLYASVPNGLHPLTEACLLVAGARRIPAASVLVRIVKAPCDKQGRPLEAVKVPQTDWEQLGLWVAPPGYEHGYYVSRDCQPTPDERLVMRAHARRAALTARDALPLVVEGTEVKALQVSKDMEAFIKRLLTRLLGTTTNHIDLTYITRYSPKYGFKVALDGASNLPWEGFTHANICLNPPGALYRGPPNAMYDRPVFTTELDLRSFVKNPRWTDNYKWFPHRSHNQYLCAILHLHEVLVSVEATAYKYDLADQAWAAVPLLRDQYAITTWMQVPLFQGSPSRALLTDLSKTDYFSWRTAALKNKKLKLVDGASVWVRVADGRRGDELVYSFDVKDKAIIDRTLLLENSQYAEIQPLVREATTPGMNHTVPSAVDVVEAGEASAQGAAESSAATSERRLEDMLPGGRTPLTFIDKLAANFKTLVYRFYNEGGVMLK